MYKTADHLIVQFAEVIMIDHRVGIGLHAILKRKGSVRLVGNTHDGVIERELGTYGHEELLVTQLITQSGTAAYKAVILIDESFGVDTAVSRRHILDTGGKEVRITYQSPETQAMCDIAVVIRFGTGVSLVDRLHLLHVLRFFFGCTEVRIFFHGRFGSHLLVRRLRFRFSRLCFGFLFLLGSRCFGLFLLLSRLCFRFIFRRSRLGFFLLLGCRCFRLLFFLLRFGFLFLLLRLRFGLRLVINGKNRCYTVIY